MFTVFRACFLLRACLLCYMFVVLCLVFRGEGVGSKL